MPDYTALVSSIAGRDAVVGLWSGDMLPRHENPPESGALLATCSVENAGHLQEIVVGSVSESDREGSTSCL